MPEAYRDLKGQNQSKSFSESFLSFNFTFTNAHSLQCLLLSLQFSFKMIKHHAVPICLVVGPLRYFPELLFTLQLYFTAQICIREALIHHLIGTYR